MLGFEIRTKDKVTVDDKLIKADNFLYYKFYKPTGCITTKDDEKGRKTIYDYLPGELHILKPVGRLDKDSSGLLILTNDGDLIYELTHPSIKVSKVYHVKVDSKIKYEELEILAKGIELEKGKIAYCDSMILEQNSNSTLLEITLYQGINRQIRRMFEYFGHRVINLKRIRHATLDVVGLKRGQYKQLKPKQIRELKSYIEKIKENKDYVGH